MYDRPVHGGVVKWLGLYGRLGSSIFAALVGRLIAADRESDAAIYARLFITRRRSGRGSPPEGPLVLQYITRSCRLSSAGIAGWNWRIRVSKELSTPAKYLGNFLLSLSPAVESSARLMRSFLLTCYQMIPNECHVEI